MYSDTANKLDFQPINFEKNDKFSIIEEEINYRDPTTSYNSAGLTKDKRMQISNNESSPSEQELMMLEQEEMADILDSAADEDIDSLAKIFEAEASNTELESSPKATMTETKPVNAAINSDVDENAPIIFDDKTEDVNYFTDDDLSDDAVDNYQDSSTDEDDDLDDEDDRDPDFDGEVNFEEYNENYNDYEDETVDTRFPEY